MFINLVRWIPLSTVRNQTPSPPYLLKMTSARFSTYWVLFQPAIVRYWCFFLLFCFYSPKYWLKRPFKLSCIFWLGIVFVSYLFYLLFFPNKNYLYLYFGSRNAFISTSTVLCAPFAQTRLPSVKIIPRICLTRVRVSLSSKVYYR